MLMESYYWAVVCTQTHRERWAAENVRNQGFEFYLPSILITSARNGRKIIRAQALFPRYLFVRLSGQWRFLLSTFGVVDVVLSGGAPARMPARYITELKNREDDSGFIILPQKKRFHAGQRVRVSGGALAGRIGIYEGSTLHDRQKVLLDLLGGKTKVLVGKSDLEAA
jgi:transcriptional antiterminator RfaH